MMYHHLQGQMIRKIPVSCVRELKKKKPFFREEIRLLISFQ